MTRGNGVDQDRAWALAALSAECQTVAGTAKGGRNDQLNRSAFAIGQIVGGGHLAESEAAEHLWKAAKACGLGNAEIAPTLGSGLKAGKVKPRHPPARGYDSNTRFRSKPDRGNGGEAGAGGAIRLLTFQEFRSSQAHSSADSLISGLMRLGTIVAIGGRPGSGKTAFAVALGQALDQGEPFLEREVKQAAVAYIAVEDAGDVANRLEATGADGVLLVHSEEGIPLAKPARARAITAEVIQHARQRRPGRPIFVVIDTLRAALGGTSVLEDKIVSPALNALRELAEAENAVICILNHTNRADPKAMKGETLEAVAALEMILLPGEGDWHTIHVGKNRSGPGNRQIGRLRFTSVKVGGVEAAIVEEIVCDEQAGDGPKDRKPGANQRLILKILTREVLASGIDYRPYGSNGPQVKAVREGVLRDEFLKMKAGDNRNSKNVAFNRALDWLLERAEVVRNEDEAGVGMIWFGSRDDEDDAMRQRLKVAPGNDAGREGGDG